MKELAGKVHWLRESSRNKLRSTVVDNFRKLLLCPDLRGDIGQLLQSFGLGGHNLPASALKAHPYPELLATQSKDDTAKKPVIFVTGRFRSGSTLLWNIFRALPGYTAFYEPFNERKWFDQSQRGDFVDASHRGVSDYWTEYDGLDHLSDIFDESWCTEQLYMDEHAYAPRMKQYIDALIAHAEGTAVLQFNRLDFRLPWIKKHYPEAKIVHICRNPRDQWVSTLWKDNKFGPESPIDEFVDHFYLKFWRDDLLNRFPVLGDKRAQHPYQIFYFIWRLSAMVGQEYSTVSIRLEDLTDDPEGTLIRLFDSLSIDQEKANAVADVVGKADKDKWKNFASTGWFEEMEMKCEAVLEKWL